jgi:hypothetical protein
MLKLDVPAVERIIVNAINETLGSGGAALR